MKGHIAYTIEGLLLILYSWWRLIQVKVYKQAQYDVCSTVYFTVLIWLTLYMYYQPLEINLEKWEITISLQKHQCTLFWFYCYNSRFTTV